ncbi:MAG: glycoside hydrolase [Acidobacteriia bacterium]|nr:glycoside hydrolase [Terriglobia bacterium]
MRWRGIGPFRGGRTRAVAGDPSRPGIFYIGVCNGGVWKTNDYGVTWAPIFDDQPTGSIGAIAVSLSDPNIVYVGSGEGLHRPDLSTGDGIYKSTDSGKSWTHLGLRDGQQIPSIAVDPRDPNRLFVAVLGHPYGPNEERGIYRSTDGGQSFQKVLYKDENTGGSDVELDPSNLDTIYAALWEAREGPWENGQWSGTSGGIFKSTDGGNTWRQLTKGLPEGVTQSNLAIAPSQPQRIYAAVATNHDAGISVGVYRSDDAGESWTLATTDTRPGTRIGGGDLPVPKVDPKNPDIVYSASIVTWKSTDGGKTWTALRGAPGGDDYQNIWIDPHNSNVIIVPGDQGAIVTVNGGESWSSWYNQPTAQLYHVSTDNAFPYRVCSGQQESGSVCISSRGNDGEITIREWHPVAAEEYGYVVADPLDPDIVYGGKLSRYDRRTGQAQDVLPKLFRSPDYRMLRTQPVLFSPVDPHTLYFAANTLWKTRDGGHSWQQISPDLTRKAFAVPASVGKYRDTPTATPMQRGVIYAVAPSPLDINRIWAGTDDGLIHLTTDGGAHWTEITPPQLVSWAKVSVLEASHFDPQTAYAAINTIRLDDPKPYIYRTRDGGKTWTAIANDIPDRENVNAVREDPKRKGLLFAGTERQVLVSFDDGDHWQSLRLNMPATSVRDLTIKDDDLIAATHGRGFWILDNITPLRQLDIAIQTAAFLFKPQVATRVRWSMASDTPLPPDFPAGENPPDGAIFDYVLNSNATGPVTLEILDSSGKLVRRYSSADPVPAIDPMLAIPKYWLRPPQGLSGEIGFHRFLWDMHYPPVPGSKPPYPISAVYRKTVPQVTAPWVMPGQYTVRLTVSGKSYTQPLTVRMDPRVKTPSAGLEQQFTLSKAVYDDLVASAPAAAQLHHIRTQLRGLKERAGQDAVAAAVAAADKKAEALEGNEEGRPTRPTAAADSFASVRGRLRTLLRMLQNADVAPTTQQAAAAADRRKALASLLAQWSEFSSRDIPALNRQLRDSNLPELNFSVPAGENSAESSAGGVTSDEE